MRVGILPCVLMLGCRGLLGIEDPTVVGGDGGPTDGHASCTGDDYDADGTPDSCDPCPMYAGQGADLDGDGDGIGNGCDPRPQDGGDKRLLWTHFASASDIATWSKSGGTWIVGGDRLVQSDAAATARIALPDTYSNVHIATEIDILSRGTTPYAGTCGYIGANTFKCCDVTDDPTNMVELMAWSPFGTSVIDWAGGFQAGTTYELATTARNTTLACHVRRLPLATDVMLASNDTSGTIALHTREAAVAYRYLFVVQMPP